MPRIRIDLEAKDAAERLLTLMVWPYDQEAGRDYLATVGGVGDQAITDLAPQNEAELVAEIKDLYLRPNGGLGRLARAPGTDKIGKNAMAAGGKFGVACGEILFNIATLDRHHPDFRASKNLAMHIMIRRAKHVGRDIPGERDRKTMWTKWGPVAPLWAAYLVCKVDARRRGIPWRREEWARPIVTTSLWFADFAIGFKAERAEDWLLSEDVVIRVNPDMEPADPELRPFSDQEIDWARDYKATPRKKN